MEIRIYNINNKSTAYHCGGLVAVQLAVLRHTEPKLSTAQERRYLDKATAAPMLVIGQLSGIVEPRLCKLNKVWADAISSRLQEVACAVGTDVPSQLNYEQRSQFELGYLHMSEELSSGQGSSKLRDARQNAGLTQSQMSELLGIPKRTIEEWDRGTRKCPEWAERLIVEKLEALKAN